MKFWAAPHKKFSDQIGRFIFEDLSSNANPQPSIEEAESNAIMRSQETSDALSEGAREAAMLDTEMALADLQSQIEANEASPSELPIDEQVMLLVRIARNDFQSDTTEGSGDDRTNFQWIRDGAGAIVDGFIPAGLAESLQSGTDFSYEGAILDALDPSAKSRFLLDYRSDAKNLFTDTLSEAGSRTAYRANFYGDTDLARSANFMDLLSATEQNEQFLQINDGVYVRTPLGYLGFSPEGIVGNRAKISSDTNFSTFGEADLTDNNNQTLTLLKENSPAFMQIKESDEMARLEQNRSTNFHTAETWKNFSNTVGPILAGSDIPFIQELNTLFEDGGNFRRFLDANTRLDNYDPITPGEPFIIPGFGQVPGLDALSSPGEFRDGIINAIKKVTEYAEAEVEKYETAIATETNQETQALMISSLETLTGSLPNLLGTMKSHIENLREDNKKLLEANTQLILAEFENLNPEQLNQWLTEFDTSLAEMAQEGTFDSNTFDQQLGLLFAKILGSSAEEGLNQLEQNPQLKEILLARLNTIAREPGIDHLEGTAMVFEQQMYVRGIIETLAAIDESLVADLDLENITPEQLAELVLEAQHVKSGLEMKLKNDETLPEEEQQLLNFLNVAIPALIRSEAKMEEGEDIREEALQTEEVLNDAVARGVEVLDQTTEEGESFHETVDVATDYVREYRGQNNGEIPDLTPEDFQFITEQVKNGVAPERIINNLRQNKVLETTNSTPVQNESVSALTSNLNSIPMGANLVGVTSEGFNIVQVAGGDNERFIQNPSDNTFIAEKFANIPDREDLKTNNFYLAQIYASFTSGSVLDSPLRKTAQAAERGGSISTTKLISNYLAAANRNPQQIMSPNESRQWEQLGQMCNSYNIELDAVFARLSGAPRMDGTINPNPTDNGTTLVALLETAVAGNKTGFEELMGINTPNRLG